MRKSFAKRMFSLCGALLIFGSLLGCQPGEGSSSTDSPSSVPPVELELPKMEITNKKLRFLNPNAGVMRFAETYLKTEYGIDDLEIVNVPPAEVRTRFVNSVMSNDYFDIYWDNFSPSLINGGYVQAIDVDMTAPIWSEVVASNEQYMWNGKRYYVVPGFAKQIMVYYNKNMFDEAGETYPTELFDNGEWDWNKLLELAQTLTLDSDRDGTPEQYGLSCGEPELLMFTTGKHLVTFMPDGTARNNIGSPEVARAVAFYSKLLQSRTMTTSDAYKAFAAGTVAMSIGHRWVANDCAKLIQADSLGVAPLPRDPDADQYYTEEEGGGFYVSKGAPNLQGAIACCNVYAYVIRSKAYIRDQYEYNIDNGVWTEELQKQYERNNQLVGVLRNWESFNMGDYWGDLFSRPAGGEPWETIAAELSPKVDARIKELYEAKE